MQDIIMTLGQPSERVFTQDSRLSIHNPDENDTNDGSDDTSRDSVSLRETLHEAVDSHFESLGHKALTTLVPRISDIGSGTEDPDVGSKPSVKPNSLLAESPESGDWQDSTFEDTTALNPDPGCEDRLAARN
jgi:hypothetical protein